MYSTQNSTQICIMYFYTEFYTDLPYVFLHRVLHRFTEHISTQISTQICDTSVYTELYTESKYISTYFFQSSAQSWKTLFNEFIFFSCAISFFEDSAISIPGLTMLKIFFRSVPQSSTET